MAILSLNLNLKMADILELEKLFPVLLEKNYEAVWFSIDQLAARWGRDESEVDDVLTQIGAEIVDPVGKSIDYMMLVHPSGGKIILPASDFIYKRSDIDRIETELEIKPLWETPATIPLPEEEKIDPTQVTDNALRIHFRKLGDFWIIGPDEGQPPSIKHMGGLILLKDPDRKSS